MVSPQNIKLEANKSVFEVQELLRQEPFKSHSSEVDALSRCINEERIAITLLGLNRVRRFDFVAENDQLIKCVHGAMALILRFIGDLDCSNVPMTSLDYNTSVYVYKTLDNPSENYVEDLAQIVIQHSIPLKALGWPLEDIKEIAPLMIPSMENQKACLSPVQLIDKESGKTFPLMRMRISGDLIDPIRKMGGRIFAQPLEESLTAPFHLLTDENREKFSCKDIFILFLNLESLTLSLQEHPALLASFYSQLDGHYKDPVGPLTQSVIEGSFFGESANGQSKDAFQQNMRTISFFTSKLIEELELFVSGLLEKNEQRLRSLKLPAETEAFLIGVAKKGFGDDIKNVQALIESFKQFTLHLSQLGSSQAEIYSLLFALETFVFRNHQSVDNCAKGDLVSFSEMNLTLKGIRRRQREEEVFALHTCSSSSEGGNYHSGILKSQINASADLGRSVKRLHWVSLFLFNELIKTYEKAFQTKWENVSKDEAQQNYFASPTFGDQLREASSYIFSFDIPELLRRSVFEEREKVSFKINWDYKKYVDHQEKEQMMEFLKRLGVRGDSLPNTPQSLQKFYNYLVCGLIKNQICLEDFLEYLQNKNGLRLPKEEEVKKVVLVIANYLSEETSQNKGIPQEVATLLARQLYETLKEPGHLFDKMQGLAEHKKPLIDDQGIVKYPKALKFIKKHPNFAAKIDEICAQLIKEGEGEGLDIKPLQEGVMEVRFSFDQHATRLAYIKIGGVVSVLDVFIKTDNKTPNHTLKNIKKNAGRVKRKIKR